MDEPTEPIPSPLAELLQECLTEIESLKARVARLEGNNMLIRKPPIRRTTGPGISRPPWYPGPARH